MKFLNQNGNGSGGSKILIGEGSGGRASSRFSGNDPDVDGIKKQYIQH